MSLGALIRDRRADLLARWQHGVRALPHVAGRGRPHLVDLVPALLDRLAAMAEAPATAPRPEPGERAPPLDESFDVLEAIDELGVVRDAVHAVLRDAGESFGLDELGLVERAIDAAVKEVVREQAQAAARQVAESDRQLRALADNIPQLAWMADPRGVPYWFNAGWYAYTGLAPEDMRGAWKARVHHPAHAERVERAWEDAIAAGTPWEDELALRGKDGYYRWFLARAVPIRDAAGHIERWFGTNTDVTARRFLDQATTVLGSSLEDRAVLEQLARLAVPDLADWCIVDLIEHDRLERVAIVHAGGHELELARRYARAHAPDLELETGTRDVIRGGVPRMAADITHDMRAASAPDAEHQRLLRELGFTSWIGAPLVARGQTLGIIHLVMSDSGRRYTSAELAVATELGQRAGVAIDNARLYRNAQEAVRIRDDVLAIVSHDLRNPLGAIDLAARLLLQQGGEARERKHVATIRRSTERMERLIDDLLDMASINVGRFSIQPGPLEACQVIDEALDIHEALASERGIRLVRACDLAGVRLDADRNRLVQALGNLLGNAIKFCSAGDVVTVRAARDGDRMRVSIADTGPGIPRAELPHIFEPYWSGRTDKKKGTGLGLFITKAIVEAHGGTIDVDSSIGRGTTFELALPVANGSRAAAT